MQSFVLDASVVISFLLQERSVYADGVFEEHLARGAMAHVPSLWHLEIRSVLFLNERAKKLSAGEAHQALRRLRRVWRPEMSPAGLVIGIALGEVLSGPSDID